MSEENPKNIINEQTEKNGYYWNEYYTSAVANMIERGFIYDVTSKNYISDIVINRDKTLLKWQRLESFKIEANQLEETLEEYKLQISDWMVGHSHIQSTEGKTPAEIAKSIFNELFENDLLTNDIKKYAKRNGEIE